MIPIISCRALDAPHPKRASDTAHNPIHRHESAGCWFRKRRKRAGFRAPVNLLNSDNARFRYRNFPSRTGLRQSLIQLIVSVTNAMKMSDHCCDNLSRDDTTHIRRTAVPCGRVVIMRDQNLYTVNSRWLWFVEYFVKCRGRGFCTSPRVSTALGGYRHRYLDALIRAGVWAAFGISDDYRGSITNSPPD